LLVLVAHHRDLDFDRRHLLAGFPVMSFHLLACFAVRPVHAAHGTVADVGENDTDQADASADAEQGCDFPRPQWMCSGAGQGVDDEESNADRRDGKADERHGRHSVAIVRATTSDVRLLSGLIRL
jgi:hypothetical protein